MIDDPVEDADGGLFVTEKEMFRRLGVSPKIGRAAIHELERRHPGRPSFPQKDPLFANRRFWPAVLRYFMIRHGVLADPRVAVPPLEPKPDMVERFLIVQQRQAGERKTGLRRRKVKPAKGEPSP